MNKSSRLHIFEYLSKKNLIQLASLGPKMLSPLSFCQSSRKDCLKYLLRAPGIEDVKINGSNVIDYLSNRVKMLKYFSVSQLVKMLGHAQKDSGLLVAEIINPKLVNESHTYYMALKEMLKDPKMVDQLSFCTDISAKTIACFTGKAVCYEDFSGHTSIFSKAESTLKFLGNTSFNIAFLPAELLEMVTSYLGAEDQARLFAASKAIHEMLTDYHWHHMLQHESSTLYRQLESDTKTSWYDKAAPRLRSSYNWKIGKCAVKKTSNVDIYWAIRCAKNRRVLASKHHQIPPSAVERRRRLGKSSQIVRRTNVC
jgi:hypothetical protein